MSPAVNQILGMVENLSMAERADVVDHIVEGLDRDVPPEVADAHIDEVRRRIAEVESGKVELIPGEVVMARIWKRLKDRIEHK